MAAQNMGQVSSGTGKRTVEQPLKSNQWSIVFPEDIFPSRLAESADLIIPGISSENITQANVEQAFASRLTSSAFSVRFMETEKLEILSGFMLWKSKIITPDGLYQYPSFYRKPIEASLLSSMRKPLATIKYENCWPSSEYKLTADNLAQLVYITIAFNFTKCTISFLGNQNTESSPDPNQKSDSQAE